MPNVPKRCGTGAPCRVFVTSTFSTGDLGGLLGADAKCQARAAAAGLTRAYKAWLSDSTNSPGARFTNTATTGPYVLVDPAATVVADNWAELTSGTLQAAINKTEMGADLEGPVWTNTQANGTVDDPDTSCVNWMSDDESNLGGNSDTIVTDSGWTAFGSLSCDHEDIPLYCFEPD